MHYLQILERDHPLVMRPGVQYRLALEFKLRPRLCRRVGPARRDVLSTRIIPCLDVHAGRVVKGVNFVDLIDAGDPVEQAKAYEQQGADELVFLDITASSDERGIMHDVVERTASECFMPLTVGGGLREVSDIRDMLNAESRQSQPQYRCRQQPRLDRRSRLPLR